MVDILSKVKDKFLCLASLLKKQENTMPGRLLQSLGTAYSIPRNTAPAHRLGHH